MNHLPRAFQNRPLVGLLALALCACQGCGTLWRIPRTQTVAFLSRPEGATVAIVDQATQEVYARVKTPADVTFTSSPWRKRRPHVYRCTFTAENRVPVEVPLQCEIPNGMHLLWTAGYPVGLISACVDDLCGAGSCRFRKEIKVRLFSED